MRSLPTLPLLYLRIYFMVGVIKLRLLLHIVVSYFCLNYEKRFKMYKDEQKNKKHKNIEKRNT